MERRSFDEVDDLLRRDRRFVGPPAPLRDHVLVVGALFVPWNDQSDRWLQTYPREQPWLEAIWTRDFCGVVASARIPVAQVVVDDLVQSRLVESRGGNVFERRLSALGRRQVTVWYQMASVMDVFAAGASFDVADGTFRWPRESV